jgi:hypothetical protein
MRKSTITTTWIGGLVAIAAGLILSGVSIGLMLAQGGTFEAAPSGQGYDFVPALDAFFWTMVTLTIVGFGIAAVGGLAQLAAWIGALVNTYRLPDKTWFAVVLAAGVLGFAFGLLGFAGMLAYVIAGPDGTALPEPPTAAPAKPPALAPTS